MLAPRRKHHLFFGETSNVYVSRKCCSSSISLDKKQQVPRHFLADEKHPQGFVLFLLCRQVDDHVPRDWSAHDGRTDVFGPIHNDGPSGCSTTVKVLGIFLENFSRRIPRRAGPMNLALALSTRGALNLHFFQKK